MVISKTHSLIISHIIWVVNKNMLIYTQRRAYLTTYKVSSNLFITYNGQRNSKQAGGVISNNHTIWGSLPSLKLPFNWFFRSITARLKILRGKAWGCLQPIIEDHEWLFDTSDCPKLLETHAFLICIAADQPWEFSYYTTKIGAGSSAFPLPHHRVFLDDY